jgi:hypothetical protein
LQYSSAIRNCIFVAVPFMKVITTIQQFKVLLCFISSSLLHKCQGHAPLMV